MIWFERLFYAALALRPLSLVLGWDGFTGRLTAAGVPTAALIALSVAGVLIPFVVAWFAARRASRVAAWLVLLWVAGNLAAFSSDVLGGGVAWDPETGLASFMFLLCFAAAVALFTPESRRWRKGQRGSAELARDFA